MSIVSTSSNCTETEHSRCNTVTVHEEEGIVFMTTQTAEGRTTTAHSLAEYDAQRQRERAAGIAWPHEIIMNSRTATTTARHAAQ